MALCIYPAILLGASLLGQTTASPPSFEAASLKLSAPGGKYSFSADPGRLEVRNVSLKILILMAYPGNSYSSAGPAGSTPSYSISSLSYPPPRPASLMSTEVVWCKL